MPRRKGHGIPPTKRVKTDQNAVGSSSQKPSKAAEKDGRTMGTSTPQNDFEKASVESPSKNSDIEGNNENSGHHKYLHKKFKKMASTVLSPEEMSLPPTVNGSRVKGVLCPVPSECPSESQLEEERCGGGDGSPLKERSTSSPLTAAGKIPEGGVRVGSPPAAGGRYVCPYCKLACAKPSVLEKHIRAHTNERPYPCIPCGFAFKTKSNLYKHCRSRAHAVKMGETGTEEGGKLCLLSEDPNMSSEEEDSHVNINTNSPSPPTASLHQTPVVPPATTTNTLSSSAPLPIISSSSITSTLSSFTTASTTTTTTTTVSSDGSQVSNEKKNERPSKTIYKPKFHTASLYVENSIGLPTKETENPNSPSPKPHGLHLKMPNNLHSTQSTPSPFTSGSSPSPEFLQRHITKLISENKAIVETMDPFWPKKFLHRSNSKETSSPSSPVSTSPVPSSDVIQPVKYAQRQCLSIEIPLTGSEYITEMDTSTARQSVQSKLALALLRPQISEFTNFSPLSTDVPMDQQPLNLTTNNKLEQIIHGSRKRSYSEGFPSVKSENVHTESSLQSSIKSIKSVSNNQLNEEHTAKIINLSLDSSDVLNQAGEKMLKTQNPEGSIIKDLLLKTRAASGTGVLLPSFNTTITDTVANMKLSNLGISAADALQEERAYSPSDRYSFQNAQNLEIRQAYYCKENEGNSDPIRHINDPKQVIAPEHYNSTVSSIMTKEKRDVPVMIAPPYPSPGPLLGNTPLVDSYHIKNDEKDKKIPIRKNKSDLSSLVMPELKPLTVTTLRSLEELSKSPMRSNLQMFGGEVKILDNPGGEAKTMRIEPLNRTSQTSDIPIDIPCLSPSMKARQEQNEGKMKDASPQIVVTISKTGFHTGGTLVQVPQKSSMNDCNVQQRSSKGGSSEFSSVHGSPTHLSNSKYPGSNKLMIPIIPNIVAPNLAVPGIPPPVQLPLVPFTSILAENSIINPLTNITGYNPLTLPPNSLLCANNAPVPAPSTPPATCLPSPYSGGIVTILHGGKAIPYVPGMPGPHTLIQTAHSSLSTEHRSSKASEQCKSISSYGSTSTTSDNNHKVQKPHPTLAVAAPNETRKLSVPSIQLDNEDLSKKLVITDVKQQVSPSIKQTPNKRTAVSPKPVSPLMADKTSTSETMSESENKGEKRFLRPSSLPLKPGTYTPKKYLSTPNNVLPLVSPETPRPRKSYGQLYLNGHAYTYLGLKCSTRVFFCTLNKPQPIYVPLSPEHSNISMYSNWKICSDADPNPFGLEPGQAMGHYDSRHRPGSYTVAENHKFEAVTHSSYWTCRLSNDKAAKSDSASKVEPSDKKDSSLENDENAPKRVKIFAGGFESNEDYIYVRGRGRGRYVCEECGIRCKKPSMLKKHIRTHTDVRPFTCKHCSFSFKTKGNLTKHMKSKAHYKKCVELGISPVPTVVDDSYIDEELLARQQAMRADQGLDPNETDDDEEEDDEDDDEDEEEDEEEVDELNSRLEREAARSLLSLSEVTLPSAAQQAGLVAKRGRPSTYPYSFMNSPSQVSTQPQTPTLTAMSAQREREKVSQNTGLARVHNHNEPSGQKPTQLDRNEPGVASRYYFPSARKFSEKRSTSESTSEHEDGSTEDEDTSSHSSHASFPVDLSNKTPEETRSRTCETALLLASLCSTVDSLPSTPVAEVSEDNQLLQAYLTERAVKQQSMKRHQYQAQSRFSSSDLNQTNFESPQSEKVSAEMKVIDKPQPFTPSKSLNFHVENLISESPIKKPATVSEPETKTVIMEEGCEKDKHNLVHSVAAAKENARDILVKTSSDAKKHALTSAADGATLGPPNKKLKAEFLPPSSGPSPSYVSVLEDGRSMCLICNKIFTKPSQLRLHVNIHYFERPFRCESCAVSFRTKGHLQKHQRSVTHLNKMSMNSTFGTATTSNPRPFKCDDCKIAFRIHGHLAKHLRSKMHIMKLECLGKLPFGTYAEMERSGVNMNDIDTTDCENSLESLQLLAQKLYEKDPSKLGQWDPNEMMPPHIQRSMSTGETSSDDEDGLGSANSPTKKILQEALSPAKSVNLNSVENNYIPKSTQYLTVPISVYHQPPSPNMKKIDTTAVPHSVDSHFMYIKPATVNSSHAVSHPNIMAQEIHYKGSRHKSPNRMVLHGSDQLGLAQHPKTDHPGHPAVNQRTTSTSEHVREILKHTFKMSEDGTVNSLRTAAATESGLSRFGEIVPHPPSVDVNTNYTSNSVILTNQKLHMTDRPTSNYAISKENQINRTKDLKPLSYSFNESVVDNVKANAEVNAEKKCS